MHTGYSVMDIMTNKPIVASKEMTLKDAAQLMDTQNVNSLLIIENDKPLGIVTDEDMVRKCIAKGLDTKKTRIKDVQETDLITITPEKDLYEALIVMRDNGIRQLPVTDKQKNILGFLTMKDIIKIQPELIDLVAEKYEVRGEQSFIQDNKNIAEDDGSWGFFSKLKLRKKK